MIEEEVRNFWQNNPCGAALVGDLTENSKESYLEFFERYDKYRYAKEPHILEKLDEIDLKGKKVLEIGLGQGADAEQIIRRGGIYSGIDLTEESVNRVKLRLQLKDLPFDEVVQGSALKMPFETDSFDFVYSFGVLHHIPEISVAEKEIARVLRPTGTLLAMLYAKYSLNYLISIFFVRRLALIVLYLIGSKRQGLIADHLKLARDKGLFEYLKMKNFIHANTDGAFNPYSKVYSAALTAADFRSFTLLSTEKAFMHAPPLKVNWLPLGRMLGWHLWAEMRPRSD